LRDVKIKVAVAVEECSFGVDLEDIYNMEHVKGITSNFTA
jgi:hypothetical protein